MILRRIFTVLRDGLTAFAANPALYDTLYQDFLGMEPRECAAIKAALARAPVRVQHGYPHTDIQMPCMCLILQAESVSQKFLGDVAYLPLGGRGAGSQYEISAQLLIYSENIDLTQALYELARAVLIVSHQRLAQEGIQSPNFTGMDLAPDARYLPEQLFCRVLGIRAQYMFALPELLEEQVTATLMTGLFLQPGTPRGAEAYESGVTIAAPTPNAQG